jgi:predicted transcriptional regulator
MTKLNYIDNIILHYLEKQDSELTTNEIATATKIVWITAHQSLEKLHSLKHIIRRKEGTTKYWKKNN